MITEADTCRQYVLPKLQAAGWADDLIREQKTFTGHGNLGYLIKVFHLDFDHIQE
ncbi:hypothetical protein GCM10010840_14730 [Deinococcus aerolatus]|uniref:Uncharacterized protein n=1 Tax=Deinococcus aerolatus TaxID=522487 RepID=A0ABQ2G6M9_9DEIO|nr:hypothetical protein [Deinococcus aerolatus]GGL77889.1 hypothetical protein GCM10010840_14730 [Deinococcus aerolatus]